VPNDKWSKQLEVPKMQRYQPPDDWLSSSAREDQEEPWDVKIHAAHFCEKTSLHGLQYLGEKNRHICERLMNFSFKNILLPIKKLVKKKKEINFWNTHQG